MTGFDWRRLRRDAHDPGGTTYMIVKYYWELVAQAWNEQLANVKEESLDARGKLSVSLARASKCAWDAALEAAKTEQRDEVTVYLWEASKLDSADVGTGFSLAAIHRISLKCHEEAIAEAKRIDRESRQSLIEQAWRRRSGEPPCPSCGLIPCSCIQ